MINVHDIKPSGSSSVCEMFENKNMPQKGVINKSYFTPLLR